MTENVIMDIVIAALLVLFVVSGARKGLLKSVAGLVIFLVALVGAAIFSNTVTPFISEMVQPILMEAVEEKIAEAVENIDLNKIDLNDISLPESIVLPEGITIPDGVTLPENFDLSGLLDSIGGTLEGVGGAVGSMLEKTDPAERLNALLSQLGIDPVLAEKLAEAALEKAEAAGVSIVEALIQGAVETVVHAIVFLISFLVLTILLKILLAAMDLVLMLPGLCTLNALGGAAVALVEGALLVFLLVWVARQCAVDVMALAEDTVIFHFFVTNTPLSVITFL